MRNLFGAVGLLLALTSCGGKSNDKASENLSFATPITLAKTKHEHRQGEKAKHIAAFKDGDLYGYGSLGEPGVRSYDVLSYDLRGTINWSQQTLNASLNIALVSRSREIEFDARDLEIFAVESQGKQLPFVREKNLLRISLPIEGDTTLVISYQIQGQNEWDGLKFVGPREGDPVKSRAFYTFSEPMGASRWMPCNDFPADRARFSVSLTLPQQEYLIANGELVSDQVNDDGTRTMSYSTLYTLPTYLMAFAGGELEVASDDIDGLPIGLIKRRGFPADTRGLMELTKKQFMLFSGLLGRYPFEKYYVILLPEFLSGGIEHAGITFNNELRSGLAQVGGDRNLMAHELAHQWFGDYVTVKSWDDLWIKEGMATLLAEEASRSEEDKQNSGRFFGSSFGFEKGQAIRDKSLGAEEKYTSGPYDRAAWLLAQLRAKVGEEAFWDSVRRILNEHAWGSVGTEEFLAYFPLNPQELQRVLKAVDAKDVPRMEVQKGELVLTDRDGSSLFPLELEIWNRKGHKEKIVWEFGAVLPHLPHGYLIVDPRDLHPDYTVWTKDQADARAIWEKWLIRSLPRSSEERKLFSQSPPAFQIMILQYAKEMGIGLEQLGLRPNTFDPFYQSIQSARGQVFGLALLCDNRLRQRSVWRKSQWEPHWQRILANPPLAGVYTWDEPQFSDCIDSMPAELVRKLSDDLLEDRLSQEQLHFVSLFPFSLENALKIWGHVALNAGTLRSRLLGLAHINDRIQEAVNAKKLKEEVSQKVHEYFFTFLPKTRVSQALGAVIEAVRVSKDPVFLPQMASIASDQAPNLMVRKSAVCAAHAISAGASNPQAQDWQDFLRLLDPLSQMPEVVRTAAQNPLAECVAE